MSGRRQPVLRVDDRLILRPWTHEDVAAVVDAYADPDIQHWNLHCYDESQAQDLVSRWNDSWREESGAHWAIARSFDDVAIGRVGLRTLDLDAGEGEVSYWVSPGARGAGAASLATDRLSRFLLDELGVHRLTLGHSTRNVASCRVAMKAGYELEGTMRSALLHRDGWHDMHWHARIGTPRH